MTIRVITFNNGSVFQYEDSNTGECNRVVNYMTTNSLNIELNQTWEDYHNGSNNAPTRQPEQIYSATDGWMIDYDYEAIELAESYQRETERRTQREERRATWSSIYNSMSRELRDIWDNHSGWDNEVRIYKTNGSGLKQQLMHIVSQELAFTDPNAFIKEMEKAEAVLKEINMERIRRDGSHNKWNPVESSVIKAVSFALGYDRWSDSPKGTLYVLFTDGKVYSYAKVSERCHIKLLESTSKGKYFNRYIKTDKHMATDLTPPLAIINNGIQEEL